MNIAIRIILPVIAVICVSGCGTSVPTGPAPAGGYDYTPVKYDTKAVKPPSTEISVEDTTIVADTPPVSLKTPVKCKPGEPLTFRGKVVGLTDTSVPQVIAVICTQQNPWGTGMTSSGVINCKLEDGSVYYSVDLPSPTLAGKHKLEIQAVRLRKADGSIVDEGGATTSILAEGTVEVLGGVVPDFPKVAPAPDPAFSRGTSKPMK